MNDSNYKLAHLNKASILSAARRALIAADLHYYAWSSDAQERFRANSGDETRRKIQCVLLEDLLDIRCSTDKVDEVWNDVPFAGLNELNWASLLTAGIGKDYIYLNEGMEEGKSLLEFPTLYDYDHADYLFQEAARKRDFPEYNSIDYYAYRHPSWVRLLIDEKFYYADFTSLVTYIADETETVGGEIISQLIPHEYVDGKNHGKQEGQGFVWDKQINAAGQEAQLDELKSRWYRYQEERWKALSEINKTLPPAVYTQDKDWDDDPHRSFIFTNEATLKKIRWRHFLSDCEPLMAEYSDVEKLLSEEIDRTKAWLNESYQDISDNFDPTVVKLQKKRRVIMSAAALDDLNRIEQDDEPT